MSAITFTSEFGGTLPSKALTGNRVANLLERFIFASLLVLMVLVPIPFGTVEAWWVSLYECAIFGLGALWSIESVASGSWNLRASRMLAPMLALTIFVFLQSISLTQSGGVISADPFETRLSFLKVLALAINAALLLRYMSNPRRLSLLIHVVIGVAVASALFGIARQALQSNEAGFVLPYLRRDAGFGQFVNKNHFAFLMEMAIGLTSGFILGGAVRGKHLLLYLSAVAMMWTGLVLTNSRGGLFSMLGQIAFLIAMFIWLRSRTRGRSQPAKHQALRLLAPVIALSISLLIVVAVSAIWVGGDVLVTRLAALPGEIKTETHDSYAGVRRREVWSATWELIKAHPVTGSGFGAYGVAITKFHKGSGKWIPEAAHNDYLELLASGGLIGVGLVVWLGFSFIKRARRQILGADLHRRAACLGALTGIFGVMAHSVVDFGLHVTANAVIFVALVVTATSDSVEKT